MSPAYRREDYVNLATQMTPAKLENLPQHRSAPWNSRALVASARRSEQMLDKVKHLLDKVKHLLDKGEQMLDFFEQMLD